MEKEDMDKIVAASEWKGYWESLIKVYRRVYLEAQWKSER